MDHVHKKVRKNSPVGHHALKQWIPAQQGSFVFVWDPDLHLTADILNILSLADRRIPPVWCIFMDPSALNFNLRDILHVNFVNLLTSTSEGEPGTFWKHNHHCCFCTGVGMELVWSHPAMGLWSCQSRQNRVYAQVIFIFGDWDICKFACLRQSWV